MFSFMGDVSYPFFCCLIPMHADEPASVVGLKPLIALILKMIGFSKVFSTIVKRVVVFMVSFFVWSTAKNFFGHVNRIFPSYSIKAFGVRTPARAPIPLVEPVK